MLRKHLKYPEVHRIRNEYNRGLYIRYYIEGRPYFIVRVKSVIQCINENYPSNIQQLQTNSIQAFDIAGTIVNTHVGKYVCYFVDEHYRATRIAARCFHKARSYHHLKKSLVPIKSPQLQTSIPNHWWIACSSIAVQLSLRPKIKTRQEPWKKEENRRRWT